MSRRGGLTPIGPAALERAWAWLAGPGVIDLYPARQAWLEKHGGRPPLLFRRYCPTHWWWFAHKQADRDTLVTWRDPSWWVDQWWARKGRGYEALLWVGILDLPEGWYYHEARWTWPWRARAPGWRQPTHTIYTWPVYQPWVTRRIHTTDQVTFRKASEWEARGWSPREF